MSNYTMSRYFQNMKVPNVLAAKPNPENVKELKEIEQDIHTCAEKLLSTGTPGDKIHTEGQYTTLERINQLVGEGTFCLLNTLYNPEDNVEEKIGTVSAGIVKDLGRIDGKWAVIIASDNKKMAGAWIPGQTDNLLRGSDMARVLGIPLVYILSCSGIKLDEQEKVYPSCRGGGMPLYRNSELNQLGVSVIVGIYGTNLAGGGYHAISLTTLITHEKINMAVGGAGIVGGMDPKPYVNLEGAQGMIDVTRRMKNDPSGSVSIHYNMIGFSHEAHVEEFGVLDSIKKCIDYMSAFNPEFFRVDTSKASAIQGEEPYDIVSRSTRRTYDMYNVLKALLDGSEFMEHKKDYGPEMITGIAKVNGLSVGIVANRQGVLAAQGHPNYPEYRGKDAMGMGDKLYRQDLVRMSEFVILCGCDRFSITWVQNTIGTDVSNEVEKTELSGLGQSLIYSIQSTKFSMFEIMLRKGTAAAHYVFDSPQGDDNSVFLIGTAATEINVMYGKTAAGVMYSRRLVKNQGSGKDLQGTIDKMDQLIQHYIDTSTSAYCARADLVDRIVDMPKTRGYVVAFADVAYQNPKSICPVHQMILPRIIKDYDENDQNAKTAGAKA